MGRLTALRWRLTSASDDAINAWAKRACLTFEKKNVHMEWKPGRHAHALTRMRSAATSGGTCRKKRLDGSNTAGATAHISREGCGGAVVAWPKQLRGEVCEGACRGASEQEETLPQMSGDGFYFERYPSTPKSASAAAMKVSVKCV
jgi:hypothetical protein